MRVYGELEFWFALLKVVTIVALIVSGLAVIFFKIGALGPTASFSNLWTHQGFMPFGLLGVLLTLQIVMFAYSGVELIGVTAGEAENPEVSAAARHQQHHLPHSAFLCRRARGHHVAGAVGSARTRT